MIPCILVVDDSRASRLLITSVIKKLLPNTELLEAGHGEEALEKMKERPITLAILDMNMPGMTGLTLAEHIKASSPSTKLAMLTANTQEAIQNAAKALGIHFFKKPVTPAVLSDIIKLLD